MIALDLFCGAGGAAMGLHRAGFDVVGVDIEPQPNYPFDFILASALDPPFDLTRFDLIWASPPCQAYAHLTRWRGDYPNNYISATRKMLLETGKPYIIENVPSAPLHNPIVLHGEMFGLGVIRRRLFESNVFLFGHSPVPLRGGVQDGTYVTVAGHGGDGPNRYDAWAEAMDIDWMTKQELSQAVPPAYAEFLAHQVIAFANRPFNNGSEQDD